ncbi:inactive tyrosine-protein kinase transmembrane receptor ROR1-like isoform X5 [Daphnia pulex]|uniref:inactive tyrosine-protein kinase transmembrane receptor ROR1-like isoform X5 n=1 Tax=Daphnia pulex TaxID=6669 RepID=UPI001EE0FFF3|nr:inactive tyrosine-protein kinase transmembrane receptor ROR1-like isoform X5 [Daphnia pulex]XP_046634852.1 inactive tyrosine-protein kinase transmembrane receptor ROR1-like isoform X2 [Daphnia pulicaria]
MRISTSYFAVFFVAIAFRWCCFATVFGGVPIFDENVWAHGLVPGHSDSSAGGAPAVEDYDYDGSYDYDGNPKTSASANSTRSTSSRPLASSSTTEAPPDKPGTLRMLKSLSNTTRESGESVKLRCEVSGDPPPNRFRWYKNEAPVLEEKGRVVVRKYRTGSSIHGSRLRISDVDTHDTGYYKCEASNGKERVESTGIVIVRMGTPVGQSGPVPSSPNFQQPSFPSFGGVPVSLPGLPKDFVPKDPKLLLPKDFQPNKEFHPKIGHEDEDEDDDHGDGDEGDDDVDHPNSFPSMPGSLPRTNVGHGQGPLEGFCQVYRGATCSKFLANRTIFVQSSLTQGIVEEKLAAAFTVIAHSGDLSQSCAEFAVPSLCFAAFPLCDDQGGKPVPRQLCRDECEVLENDICRMEYAVAKQHPLIGEQVMLPDCEKLPPIGSKGSETCFRIGIPHMAQIVEEQSCYNEDGRDYRGIASRTTSKQDCLPWNRQAAVKSADHSELIGGHNYCRNPGGVEVQPWCFVAGVEGPNSRPRREFCSLPKCSMGYDINWLYIIIPAAAVGLLVIVILVVCCVRRSKCKAKNSSVMIKGPYSCGAPIPNGAGSNMARLAGVGGQSNQQMEMNALLPPSSNSMVSTLQGQSTPSRIHVPEISLHAVRFQHDLGEGAFGKVYKGELMHSEAGSSHRGYANDHLISPGGVMPIAIKTLKANASVKTQQDFRREVELMSELRHPNIVCLLGVVTRDQPQCMLFEYMAQGDLHEFLVAHSPAGDGSVSGIGAGSDDGTASTLEQSDFLYIAIQIAAGMEYLASHHYVHRDLAARNCLISDNLIVKISDFGLSRDIYSSDYYRVQGKSMLPVRWMPPEAILYGKFTIESDVWSFGVVLWEIYSFALQPYYGYNNQDVIDMVRSRQLLSCPSECPSRIYSLMIECWSEVPLRRPTFTEVHNRLRSWEGLASVGAPSSSIGGPPPIPATLPPTNGAMLTSRSHSGSHSGSQHSSTGPSNNTGSTNLSGASVHPIISGGNFYHQPGAPYSRGPVMSPVPSVGGNSASSTYGGTSSVTSSLGCHPAHQPQHQQQQYPVCYAQSIVPGFHSANGIRPSGPPSVILHGSSNGNNGWVGRFNTSNAAYSGSSDGGKICNL